MSQDIFFSCSFQLKKKSRINFRRKILDWEKIVENINNLHTCSEIPSMFFGINSIYSKFCIQIFKISVMHKSL